MKKILFFLIALLVSSMNIVQSQQLFATNDIIGHGNDGTLYIEGVTAYSWSDGLDLLRTALFTSNFGHPADDPLLAKFAPHNYQSDHESVKLLNEGWKDDKLSLEEQAKAKPGFYFFFIDDKGGGTPKVIPFEVRKELVPIADLSQADKKTAKKIHPEATSTTIKYVYLPVEKPLPETDSEKTSSSEDKVSKESTDMPNYESMPEVTESSSRRIYVLENNNGTEEVDWNSNQVRDDCEVKVIQRNEETVSKDNTDWPTIYMKLNGGLAFEKTDLAVDQSGMALSPLFGLSAGWYFTRHVGIGLGTDFSSYSRQKFVTTSPVPGGSVYGLITQRLDGFAVSFFGELLIRPIQSFTITGIGGTDYLSLTSSVREDIMNKTTGELEVRGVPFKEADLGRKDIFFGIGLDYCFDSGLSIGIRPTISIAGETSYPDSVPQIVRDNPPEVLTPQGKIQARGIQLSLGWQF